MSAQVISRVNGAVVCFFVNDIYYYNCAEFDGHTIPGNNKLGFSGSDSLHQSFKIAMKQRTYQSDKFQVK